MPTTEPSPPARGNLQVPEPAGAANRRRQRRPAPPNALDIVRVAFAAITSGDDPLAVDGRMFARWPARSVPLDEVRSRLLDRACPQSMRDAVWAHLVERTRTGDPQWTAGAAGIALPGLTASAARLTARFTGDPDDVHNEVLAGFLAALKSVDIGRPQIMVRLQWAAYRAGHGALLEALRTPPPVGLTRGLVAVVPAAGNPDVVLARAVAAGAITNREAALIGATRLDDITVEAWAQTHDASTIWAVYKTRRRAELRLRDHLRAELNPDATNAPSAGRNGSGEVSKHPDPGRVQHDQFAHDSSAMEDPRCA